MRQYAMAIIVFLMLHSNSIAQVHWSKHQNNPVLHYAAQPTCLIDNDTMKMWYASGYMGVSRIKSAWSIDGIIWNNYNNGNPVLSLGEENEWDNIWHDTPEILMGDDMYYLYYYGDSTTRLLFNIGTYDSITCALGMASSADGFHWIKSNNNPVLQKGDSAAFDGRWIESPTVHFNQQNQTYYMWYGAMPWDLHSSIGLGVSYNAHAWQKSAENPVLTGGPDFYDLVGVYVPCVIQSGEIFEMWYCGAPPIQSMWDSISIGYAVSIDGINWIKYPNNPVYDRFFPPVNPEADNASAWAPEVVFVQDSNKYLMYYDGSNGINLAIADRDILFSENCDISITENLTIYYGDQVQLQVNGGEHYHWIPSFGLSNPFIANPIASPEETTTYTVLIVSETCITTRQVLITVDENNAIDNDFLSVINIHPNPVKAGSEIKLNKHIRDACITIHDIAGNTLYRNDRFSGNVLNIASNIKQGIYILQIIEASHIQLIKLNI